jgi:hypothetical protein
MRETDNQVSGCSRAISPSFTDPTANAKRLIKAQN